MDCEHDELVWRPRINEDGWGCYGCDTELGFRPDLDRDVTDLKVHCLLLDFHESKLLYISNSEMGAIVVTNVALRCTRENTYDQQSILRFILDDPNVAREHAQFWRTRAERHLLGAEPIRDEQEALPF